MEPWTPMATAAATEAPTGSEPLTNCSISSKAKTSTRARVDTWAMPQEVYKYLG